MVANSIGSEEDVGKKANLKKNSRHSFNNKGGISTPIAQSIEQEAEEEFESSKPQIYRPKTPEIDEDILSGFDMRRQTITSMIKTEETVDLAQESKPVREVIKASYGVSYREDPNDGGSANVRING